MNACILHPNLTNLFKALKDPKKKSSKTSFRFGCTATEKAFSQKRETFIQVKFARAFEQHRPRIVLELHQDLE
jgi:hypothetical protein